ncbi:hypothetical protein DFH06DRAFT_1010638, partial [Mycena polygramma]
FDPNLGGHLILWDLNLVIRFPPGSSIFIPSALLRHSNVSALHGATAEQLHERPIAQRDGRRASACLPSGITARRAR